MGKPISYIVLILSLVLNVVALWANVSLVLRRLHDLDKGAIGVVWMFIPIANLIFSLYILFKKGTPGDNRYGPDPLA